MSVKPPVPAKIEWNEQARMFMRPDYWQDWRIWYATYFEDEYKTALYGGNRGRELVVDVGAHIGSFAKLWHEKNPEAVIVCVEANPDNVEVLTKNVGDFATVIYAAMTYEPGETYLLDSVVVGNGITNSTATSIVVNREQSEQFRSAKPWERFPDLVAKEEPIPKITLEEIAGRFGFDQVGVLKLDCEGCEFSILTKSKLIERTRTIFGEWHGTAVWDAVRGHHRLAYFDYGEMMRNDEGGVFHLENKRFGESAGEPDPADRPFVNPLFADKAQRKYF